MYAGPSAGEVSEETPQEPQGERSPTQAAGTALGQDTWRVVLEVSEFLPLPAPFSEKSEIFLNS